MAMRLIYMGTPDFAVPALQALAAAGHRILAVYTQPPRPAGRGQRPRPSAVGRAAEALDLPVRTPATLRDPAAQAELAALGADLAVVAAYGLILPQAVLDAPRLGCLNIHASLLPRWRGAAPIQRAILAGDAETGIAIMRMEAGLDTGPVLLHQALPIGPQDTAGDLHDRLAELGARLIVRALDRLDGLVPVPQPQAGVTWAAKLDKAEARIDWSESAGAVARRINAFAPVPGAWCLLDGARLRLLRARPVPEDSPGQPAAAPPGTLLPGDGLRVACGQGAVELLDLQREGRRPMPPDAFLRGTPLPAGTRLE